MWSVQRRAAYRNGLVNNARMTQAEFDCLESTSFEMDHEPFACPHPSLTGFWVRRVCHRSDVGMMLEWH